MVEVGSGWKEVAHLGGPFDAIHVGAAAEKLPDALLRNLKIGGLLLCPVGPDGGAQFLTLVKRLSQEEYQSTQLMGVRYVPLVDRE